MIENKSKKELPQFEELRLKVNGIISLSTFHFGIILNAVYFRIIVNASV